MSAQPIEKDATAAVEDVDPAAGPAAEDQGPLGEHSAAPDQVEVRHRAAVSLGLGVATSAVAIAYLWRAAGSGVVLDWVLCGVLTLVSVMLFRTLLDARLPLLVADELGVRFRLGRQWRGLPWEAVDQIVVSPRRGLLRDGRLVVRLHHMHRAIEGIHGRARRHAALNEKMYGAVLAVPLGLTTRILHASEQTLQDRLVELTRGRAEVVTLLPEPEPVPTTQQPEPAGPAVADDDEGERAVITDDAVAPEPERRSRWRRRARGADPGQGAPADGDETDPAETDGAVTDGAADGFARPDDGPTVDPDRRGAADPTGEVGTARAAQSAPAYGNVRSIARLGEPVPPPVIEDFEPHPAYNPVIGPELAAARTRVGLSVDELADRTRIRPHVIESIEVDDFTPCGGDFYARGHIRTLARVLGKDPVPMLAHFDDRYATAPISPRRIFEAELATGLTGSMRKTSGGPSWSLMIAAVLTLVLVWSAVRLFSVDPGTAFETPPPVLNGSAGIDNGFGELAPTTAAPPLETRLAAVQAGASVQVRDGEGTVVFDGDLVIGEVKTVSAEAPVTVTADNGAAVSVAVNGRDQGFLGLTEEPSTQVYQRPSE